MHLPPPNPNNYNNKLKQTEMRRVQNFSFWGNWGSGLQGVSTGLSFQEL